MAIPIPRLVWPYVIANTAGTAGATGGIKFTCDAGAGSKTYVGTLTAGTYVTSELLLAQLRTDMLAALSGTSFATDTGTITSPVTLSAAGVVSIVFGGLDSATITLDWQTDAGTQALGTLLGFGTSQTSHAVTANSATATATAQITQLWTPNVPITRDTTLERTSSVTVSRTVGGQNKHVRWGSLSDRTIECGWVAAGYTYTASEATTNTALERFWESTGISKFRWSADRTDPTAGATDYFLLRETTNEFRPRRYSEATELYSFTLRMGLYTT